ncbi:MAG: hypothetical protein LUG15_02695 [Oscillospiraceae bacterium]|nr:hypothetical protein [Oscillospiraceae bacterium]
MRYEYDLPERVTAPVEAGQQLGSVSVYTGDTLLQTTPLVAPESVERLSVWQLFCRLLSALVADA